MKITRKIQILFLAIVMFFAFAGPAFSALSTEVTSDTTVFTVDSKAHGTKYAGTLTIYYATGPGYPGDTTADMYVFLRLEQRKDLYAFATVVEGVDYIASDISNQQIDIETFIAETVIPALYPGVEPAPTFAIKSVDNAVQEDPLNNPSDLFFVVLDVVIAVQD